MILAFLVIFAGLSIVHVLCYLCKVVFTFMREIYVGVLFSSLGFVGVVGIVQVFLVVLFLGFGGSGLLLVSGGRLCIFEIKLMLIVPNLNFLIEFFGPIMIIVDVLGQLTILILEVVMAFHFNVFLVVTYYGISEQVALLVLLLFFVGLMLPVPDEFGVVLLGLFEVLGVVGLDLAHFLYCVDLPELVHIFKFYSVSHLSL